MQCYVKIYNRNKEGRNFGPLVELNGCFYHLCLSTWRHVQELGLTPLYMSNDDIKKFVGMMDGLAFLPVQDIAAGVVIVRNLYQTRPWLHYLRTFYKHTWVSGCLMQTIKWSSGLLCSLFRLGMKMKMFTL